MTNSNVPKIALLAVPETSPSVLFGLYDVLYSAGAVYLDMTIGEPGEELLDVQIVSQDGEPFRCLGEVLIEPSCAVGNTGQADAVVVCDTYTPIYQAPHGKYQQAIEWIKEMHTGGALVSSVCSGALLLAEAGLLNNRQAAAHWAYGELFSDSYPQVTMRQDSVLCLTEEADKIVTAGGVTSWQELALYLIARFCGEARARETAKIHLLAGHENGQLPFTAMNQRISVEDSTIARCQTWIAEQFTATNPVEQMIDISGLNSRTFARRFKAATGRRPIDYVQWLRVEEAKLLLETSTIATEEIGHLVGYEDATSFRRIFRRKTSISPTAYRKKFKSFLRPQV